MNDSKSASHGSQPRSGSAPADYRSYMLRMWWDDENRAWRITLQEVVTGETIAFLGVESMLDFLRRCPGA